MAANYDKYIYSTGTHYISNSGSDENKAYHGGKAGDQTGHEWELKPWYNRPWSVVLRYPDQNVALTIAKLSIDAALNDKIGYDQYQRETYWQALQRANYDPSKITVACEEDCTAGVSANVKAAGYLWGVKALQGVPICSSRNMRERFEIAGFQALTASKHLTSPNELLPGDVLLYENHHAAANVTVGKNARALWMPTQTEQAEMLESTEPRRYVTITGNVFVRKGPGTEYETMGVVKPGNVLPYFGFISPEGWLLVEYQRATGWVSGRYANAGDEA